MSWLLHRRKVLLSLLLGGGGVRTARAQLPPAPIYRSAPSEPVYRGAPAAPPPAASVKAVPTAAAAPAAAAGLVLPLPLPCADQPGDLTGFLLEGQGSPAGAVNVFGQAFRRGDLPRNGRLAARLADGRAVPAQLDVTVRHPDGSARFGIVSLVLPALAAGQRLGVVLATAVETAARPLDAAAMLARRQATLTLTPTGGGEPWRADLLALLRAALADGTAQAWQSGPLAVQHRFTARVPPAAIGGATSMRLVVDLAVRADGTLWVEPWLRNDIAMRPGGGKARYDLRVSLDGREALRADGLEHHQYQAWGRLLGAAAPDGSARAAAPQPLMRPDAAYLAEAGAVARYDLSTGVEEAALARLASLMAAPTWQTPLDARDVTKYMPLAGGRPDLGPATMAQAVWLMTGDPRAAAFVVGQAEAAGAAPWHQWDVQGGADGRGGWMDNRRWPKFWFEAPNGPPPLSLLQEIGREHGWALDAAHQPDLSFVPYLLTGRRAFLDGLLAQAAWNVLSVWPYVRTAPGAAKRFEDMLVVRNRQVRSAAWTIRQLDGAAWICADIDTNGRYMRDLAEANWAWMRSEIPNWTARQGEAHGWLPGVWTDLLAPWQQDYLASSAAIAARRGNEDARAYLAWAANFLVGRFRADQQGFSRNDGIAMAITVAPEGQPDPVPFKTWSEIGQTMRARRVGNLGGWNSSMGEYGRLGLQSLAAVYELLGREDARQAYLWLLSSGAPFVAPEDHARVPNYNIVPRGMPRVPGRALRCIASSAGR